MKKNRVSNQSKANRVYSSLPTNRKQQSGAALIVGLIMLLLLTIVSVAGMRETLLQEKMVGNMRDREVALQSAESALRAGELMAGAIGAPPTFSNTQGLYDHATPTGAAAVERKKGTVRVPEKEFWTQAWTWVDGNSIEYARNLSGPKESPRYVIEKMSKTLSDRSGYPGAANCGEGVVCNEGFQFDGPDEQAASAPDYRITAKGVGMTDDTIVILQSTFRRSDGL